MRVIRLLCLASLLALVVLSGTVEPGTLADVWGSDEPPVSGQPEEESRQDSTGIRITMTGIGDDAEADANEDSAGIAITMTGEEDQWDGARRSV